MKLFITLLVVSLNTLSSYASELYIRMTQSGNYRVSVLGQVQTNSTNIFRFFDLQAGSTVVNVVDMNTNFQLFNTYVTLPANQRVVAELSGNGSLTIIQQIPVSSTCWYESNTNVNNGQSGTVIVGNPGNGNGTVIVGNPGSGTGTVIVTNPGNGFGNNSNIIGTTDQTSFNAFLNILEDENFDSNKQKAAESYVTKTYLTSAQIAQILEKFDFDSYRLETAKKAYATCVDKGNYVLLKPKFSFTSYYNDLVKWTQTQ